MYTVPCVNVQIKSRFQQGIAFDPKYLNCILSTGMNVEMSAIFANFNLQRLFYFARILHFFKFYTTNNKELLLNEKDPGSFGKQNQID